ncbi:MAG: hypothetical protein K1X79_10735 [Oligoflexia bacterium]|nr:hypothetical protein [Oligoflexia bacterium]
MRDACWGLRLLISVLSLQVSLFGNISSLEAQTSPGSIAGDFSVTKDGNASYEISLVVPPGTAGMVPNLTLNYDSGSTTAGLLGIGWSLGGLSAISRCPSNLQQDGIVRGVKFDSVDRFCLDGQKLILVSGTYGADLSEYRTASETFSRVILHAAGSSAPDYFTVESKSGLIYEYGRVENSKLRGHYTDILSWNVNKVSDRNGNFYTVSYWQDVQNGFSLPQYIDYTGNSSVGLTPYNRVAITYESRSLAKTQYIWANKFKTTQRISQISMYSGSALAWSYNMTYQLNDIVKLDYISSIQECDRSGVCLPATTFQWGEQPADWKIFVAHDDFFNLSPAQGFSTNYSYPIFVTDTNADGRTDLVRVGLNQTYNCLATSAHNYSSCEALTEYSQSSYNETNSKPMVTGDWNADGRTDLARSDGYKIVVRASTANATGTYNSLPDLFDLTSAQGFNDQQRDPLFAGDWNGDGRTDLARGHLATSTQTLTIYFDFANGNGFNINSIQPVVINDPTNYYPYIFTGDWNGDGLSDFAVAWEDRWTSQEVISFYVSRGTEVVLLYDLPVPATGGSHWSTSRYPIHVGDWNGDGLTDFGLTNDYSVDLYLSTGRGAVLHQTINEFGYQQLGAQDNYPIFSADFNGDGVSDFGRVNQTYTKYYVSDGSSGFIAHPLHDDLSPQHGYSNENNSPFIVADLDGDGISDIGRVAGDKVFIQIHNSHNSTRIATITNGFGAQIHINYALLTDSSVYTKSTDAVYPVMDLQPATRVVSSTSMSDGLGGLSTHTFHYQGLKYNHQRRESLGFSVVSETDDETGIVTTTYYRQDAPFIGSPYRTEQRLSTNILVSSKDIVWTSLSFNSGSTLFGYPQQTVDNTYELDGAFVKAVSTTLTYDSWGSPTQTLVSRSDGSTEITDNTYSHDPSTWLLGKLTQSIVTKTARTGSTAAPQSRKVNFNYNNVTGNVTAEIYEQGDSQFEYTKSHTYDVFGNVISTTLSGSDFVSRTESRIFDALGQFAVQSINPLGQSESRTYDAFSGVVLSLTGPNGLTTSWSYDGFGRVLGELRADGTSTSTVYALPAAGAYANAAYVITKTVSGSAPATTYYDVLGREIMSAHLGFDGREIRVEKVYDSRGQLTNATEPYFVGDPILWSTFEYDDLNRLTREVRPGNVQTLKSYAGLSSTTTNALAQTTTQMVDAQGYVVSVTDSGGNIIQFDRDSYGNNIQIQDAAGNVTSLEYDKAGRKTKITDPDTGVSRYTFNKLGETLTETNALGSVASYAYDRLGRLVLRTTADGTDTWTYDTAAHGIGKLAQIAKSNGYWEQYAYDSYSRLIGTLTHVHGNQYLFSQTYDQYSRVATLKYPSGFAIRNQFNNLGYLSAIQNDSSGARIWEVTGRTARNQLATALYGNGLTAQANYDANNGMLVRVRAGNIQDLGFSFDAIGNLVQRQDKRMGLTEIFAYDNLNRLVQSQVIGEVPVSLSYDSLGNIVSKTDVGTYLYGTSGAGPHAVTQITGAMTNSYTYDATGNRLTSRSGRIAYSATGKVVSIRDGNNEVQFDLDVSDQRVEERSYANGSLLETKVLIGGGLYERIVGGTAETRVHYIKSQDGYVAVYKESHTKGTVSSPAGRPTRTAVMQFLHLDHLGSIQTISDARQNIVEVLSFDAWGQRRDPLTWRAAAVTSKLDRGFTGHEHLDSVALIHMNGRVYDPVIGRFTSADPIVQDPTDLQSYNRYAYVRNNPASLTDPTGYSWFKKLKQFVKIALPLVVMLATGTWAVGAATSFLSQSFLACMVWGNTAITGLSGAFAGFVSTASAALVSGAGPGESLRSGAKAAPFAALSAMASFQIGEEFGHNTTSLSKALAHGAAGGAVSAMQGQRVQSGFLSAFVGSLTEGQGPTLSLLSGGTVSALSGGKFRDGVMRAGIVYLYNTEAGGLKPLPKEGAHLRSANRMGIYAPTDEEFAIGEKVALDLVVTGYKVSTLVVNEVSAATHMAGVAIPQLDALSLSMSLGLLAVDPSWSGLESLVADRWLGRKIEKFGQLSAMPKRFVTGIDGYKSMILSIPDIVEIGKGKEPESDKR